MNEWEEGVARVLAGNELATPSCWPAARREKSERAWNARERERNSISGYLPHYLR